MDEKDGTYYLIDPGVCGNRMALKYVVKDGKVGNITVYNKYGRVDSPFIRKDKLKLLESMKQSEVYGDYDDCFYESEEEFKKRIKRWKMMD